MLDDNCSARLLVRPIVCAWRLFVLSTCLEFALCKRPLDAVARQQRASTLLDKILSQLPARL